MLISKETMIFLPLSILVIFLFILALPVLLVLGYFQIVTIGFENLGFSSEATLLIFLLMIVGSVINIPLGRTKFEYVERKVFGFFKKKLKIIFIILGIGLFLSLLSNIVNISIISSILDIISNILCFEDRTVVDYLFTNPGLFYHKVASLIQAGFFWYIILSIIFYIKNRKLVNKRFQRF